ncbi:TRAP transporter small permease subunit [Halothiobacillus sp.]|uniref:TRAP transporter small permease subunit n=1 Tax=Halothiobacillus sp. TaxID=1891311 RepID=UPI00260A2F9F|nr:TRAP transporter small permease subunit [Halothiobacillus sp.]
MNTQPESADARGSDALLALAERLDSITSVIGRVVSYLGVATVLITFVTVYLRYAFDLGYIWLQESYVWTHTAMIMLGAGYAMLRDGFVRVDLFYRHWSERSRAWVDLLGTLLFLGSFLALLAYYGWPFVAVSYAMQENSQYEGGLPGLWLLKGMLLAFVGLLGMHGLAIVLRSLSVLRTSAQGS